MAVGLLNVSAIAIISERYKGKRTCPNPWHSGFCRGCWDSCFDLWSESLDSLWLAGCLSRLRYQYSNLTFVSLICPLYGSTTDGVAVEEKHRDVKMTGGQWRTALGLAVVAAVNRLI